MREEFGPALRGLYRLKENVPQIIRETLDSSTLIDLHANNPNLIQGLLEIEKLLS
jgi:hypothetical protein